MSWRYVGSSLTARTLLPFPEEIADGVHDGLLALDLGGHQPLLLGEVLLKVLDELARAVRRLDLPVGELVAAREDLSAQEVDAGDGVVHRPVVAVGEVERIDVPLIG